MGWFVACGMFVASMAVAQTTVGGPVSVDTVWDAAHGPYLVASDVTISGGATLTIDAGATLYMAAGSGIVVQSGGLKAVGTRQAPIRITSSKIRDGLVPGPGDWGQIKILPGAVSAKTIVSQVLIEYGSGLQVQGSAPTFDYVEIRNHLGAAISMDLSASPVGVGNQAIGNQINAIVVPAGEVAGNVSWGLKGIPYLIASGTVSVGAAPKITAVNPTTLEVGSSSTMTLTGSRLLGAASVTFSAPGLTAEVLPGGSATQTNLSVTATPQAIVGATDLKLRVDAGELSVPSAFTVISPQPAITGMNPATLYAGQGAASLDITGRNFLAGSEVLVNGSSVPTTVVGASLLRAVMANQGAAGSLSLKVRSPDPINGGQYLTSNTATLPIVAPKLTLTPANARVVVGEGVELRVGIPFIAPVGGTSISLSTGANSAIATVPGTVLIPEGATQAAFNVNALSAGAATVTASRSGATNALAAITVVPQQSISLLPGVPMLNVGGAGSSVTLKLGYPDVVDHVINLSVDNPAVAGVNAAVATVLAGQQTVGLTLTGNSLGNTVLRATTATGLSGTWPIYVANDVEGALTVDGPAMPMNLAPGQKARVTFAGTTAQLLGVVVGSVTTTPANGVITVYVDRANGSNIGVCSFTGGDTCHLNGLPGSETYTLRVVPNAPFNLTTSLQVVSEVTGLPNSGPMGPVPARRVGIQRGDYGVSFAAGNAPPIIPARTIGIQRGEYGVSYAAGDASPVVSARSVGIQRGEYSVSFPAGSIPPLIVSPLVKIRK